jgi:aryl-alcohol dehydrogenase-like predicted oxidoreductase
MKKIELVKGISSSVLGFGCAPILGAVDGKSALRAIDCAIDNGVNHFDLARSYGYGEAEHFVGKVLKGKRHEVVITSKFGIAANWKAKVLSPVKPVLRTILSTVKKRGNDGSPPPKNKRIAGSLHNHIAMNSKTMRQSLEKSLSSLQTDYLDYFLLHEPLQTLNNIDELLDTANALKQEGKIRAWGLSLMLSQQPLHNQYLDRFDLLQFNKPQDAELYVGIATERGALPNVIFSPFGQGFDGSPKQALIALTNDFKNSVVLCSMFNEKHIIENASIFG